MKKSNVEANQEIKGQREGKRERGTERGKGEREREEREKNEEEKNPCVAVAQCTVVAMYGSLFCPLLPPIFSDPPPPVFHPSSFLHPPSFFLLKDNLEKSDAKSAVFTGFIALEASRCTEARIIDRDALVRRIKALHRVDATIDATFLHDAMVDLLKCRYLLRGLSAWGTVMLEGTGGAEIVESRVKLKPQFEQMYQRLQLATEELSDKAARHTLRHEAREVIAAAQDARRTRRATKTWLRSLSDPTGRDLADALAADTVEDRATPAAETKEEGELLEEKTGTEPGGGVAERSSRLHSGRRESDSSAPGRSSILVVGRSGRRLFQQALVEGKAGEDEEDLPSVPVIDMRVGEKEKERCVIC
jgi:hypothetical protein